MVLCSEAWNQLLEQIESRDQKLFGAGEIHRFNRDVEDALTRIQVKNFGGILIILLEVYSQLL